MEKVIIVGAGGHAKVVIDILQAGSQYEAIGCTDKEVGKQILGLKVIGDDSILPTLYEEGIRLAFIAIGHNLARFKLANSLKDIGFKLVNAIHPSSCISPSVKLGSGVAVMAGAILNPEVIVKNYSIINTCVSIDHECVIGEACHIAPGCTLSGNVIVGDGTFLGTGTKVIDGIKIGSWSTLGAGSVTVRDIPDNCLALGVPARVIKSQVGDDCL